MSERREPSDWCKRRCRELLKFQEYEERGTCLIDLGHDIQSPTDAAYWKETLSRCTRHPTSLHIQSLGEQPYGKEELEDFLSTSSFLKMVTFFGDVHGGWLCALARNANVETVALKAVTVCAGGLATFIRETPRCHTLDISSCNPVRLVNLGPVEAQVVGFACKDNTSIVNLSLSYPGQELGAILLLHLSPQLEHLSVVGNISGLAVAISSARVLKRLSCRCRLSPAEESEVFDALQQADIPKSVLWSYKNLSTQGTNHLADYLTESSNLEEVELDDLLLPHLNMICRMMYHNTRIRSLNLDLVRIEIGEEDGAAIKVMLQNNRYLQKLVLRINLSSPVWTRQIAAGLSRNSVLNDLTIDGSFDTRSDTETVKMLVEHGLLDNKNLKTLCICRNIGDEGAQLLAGCLKTNSTLTTLRLPSCFIGPAGTQALLQALLTNTTLEELDLLNTISRRLNYELAGLSPTKNVACRDARELAGAVTKLRGLRKLRVTFLSDESTRIPHPGLSTKEELPKEFQGALDLNLSLFEFTWNSDTTPKPQNLFLERNHHVETMDIARTDARLFPNVFRTILRNNEVGATVLFSLLSTQVGWARDIV